MTAAKWVELIFFLVDSMVWPMVTLVIFLKIQPNLKELVPLIKTIKFRGFELILADRVRDTVENVEQLDSDGVHFVEEPSVEVIDPDPRFAIIKSWALVEAAVESLAEVHLHGLARARRIPTNQRIDMLREANIIDGALAGILHDMRAIRNLVAHGEDIQIHHSTVLEFLKAATRIASIVEQLDTKTN